MTGVPDAAPAPEDDVPVPCLASAPSWRELGISMPMPALADEEGPRVDPGLPPVVDAHVHLFPDRVFEAVWRWFDQHGWPIRYKLHTPHVLSFLLSRGVERVVALHYAHKPGMARALNAYVAQVAKDEPRVIGLATVFPGEPGAVDILEEAFALGLKGVKLHCHVQCFSPDAPQLHELYEACARAGKPLVMHAGREPASPKYPCDPYTLCAAERVERVLTDHPTLKLCVPHLGADEFDAYARLLERHDTLWLDTTMAVGGYFPVPLPRQVLEVRPERILYGTDFPNIPYAWDRELKALVDLKPSEDALAGVLGGNALTLYGVDRC
ncbi:amidohydrolase family protein [Corallococcus sp. bb12-1]|uniref:amidohydrolase family protein n=1 Tax=Corallococcus sp. bb12-1 TaxID=2996784 RepID=UPI002270CA18|nr:amidohydrolase family protein [Corallococcus sp. bb12-1]MCY1044074.1 amidohydrolase family protein [Corallococcus sp. bb12-1]